MDQNYLWSALVQRIFGKRRQHPPIFYLFLRSPNQPKALSTIMFCDRRFTHILFPGQASCNCFPLPVFFMSPSLSTGTALIADFEEMLETISLSVGQCSFHRQTNHKLGLWTANGFGGIQTERKMCVTQQHNNLPANQITSHPQNTQNRAKERAGRFPPFLQRSDFSLRATSNVQIDNFLPNICPRLATDWFSICSQ